jgi:hypothetical protein
MQIVWFCVVGRAGGCPACGGTEVRWPLPAVVWGTKLAAGIALD